MTKNTGNRSWQDFSPQPGEGADAPDSWGGESMWERISRVLPLLVRVIAQNCALLSLALLIAMPPPNDLQGRRDLLVAVPFLVTLAAWVWLVGRSASEAPRSRRLVPLTDRWRATLVLFSLFDPRLYARSVRGLTRHPLPRWVLYALPVCAVAAYLSWAIDPQ